MWLDLWLINICKTKIYGHIYDVVTFKKKLWVDQQLINIYKGQKM